MGILSQCPTRLTKQKVNNKGGSCGEDLDKAKKANRVQYWVSYYLPGWKNRRGSVGFSSNEARGAEGKRKGQKREGRSRHKPFCASDCPSLRIPTQSGH